MKTKIIRPNLVDYKMFEKRVVFKSINPIEVHDKKVFYVNLIMFLIILIGVMFLYHRYENKEREKQITEKNIKDLHEEMKKY
tara:strand:+ start:102 stop:347 length:246 start_codon:yes stop_codon:yes gene_type:complete